VRIVAVKESVRVCFGWSEIRKVTLMRLGNGRV
jgi:hypothetical protein